jgi:hypothetical protein
MCTPLACSDYYGASAPPAALGRRRTCPAHRTGCPVTRAATGGSHVPCMPIGQDGRPTVPRQPRRAYAADLQHGLPTHRLSGFRSRPPRFRTAAHCSPARIRQVGAGTTLTGLCTLVSRVRLLALLAGPAPSGSADASRRCRGCLPTSPASPGSVCPQLLPDRCDDPAVVVFHLHSVMQSFVAHQSVVVHVPGQDDLLLAGLAGDRGGASVVLAGSGVAVAGGVSPNSASTRAPRICPSPGWEV